MLPVLYPLNLPGNRMAPFGRFTFSLFNLSGGPLSAFRLVYTSLTRVIDGAACENAVFLRRNANFHEFAPPDGLTLAMANTDVHRQRSAPRRRSIAPTGRNRPI